MAGFQLCILNMTGHRGWLDCLDAPTEAPGWNGTCLSIPSPKSKDSITIEKVDDETVPTEVWISILTLFSNCFC